MHKSYLSHFLRLSALAALTATSLAHAAAAPDIAAVRAALHGVSSAQIEQIMVRGGDNIVRWIDNLGGAISMTTLPTAFHETNHALDFSLSNHNGGRAAYLFDGQVYVTEFARATSPPYRIAAGEIPARVKQKTPSRYTQYFERNPASSGNDFTTLLDELNAYVGAARLELQLIPSPLFAQFKAAKVTSYDGNVGGVADFMLYTLCYLKAVRQTDEEAYARIRHSPLLMAHLQRLWTESERILNEAMPFSTAHGGLLVIDPDVVESIYSDRFITELDGLAIRHQKSPPA